MKSSHRSGHSCLVPDFSSKASDISWLNVMLPIEPGIKWLLFPSIFTKVRFFHWNWDLNSIWYILGIEMSLGFFVILCYYIKSHYNFLTEFWSLCRNWNAFSLFCFVLKNVNYLYLKALIEFILKSIQISCLFLKRGPLETFQFLLFDLFLFFTSFFDNWLFFKKIIYLTRFLK